MIQKQLSLYQFSKKKTAKKEPIERKKNLYKIFKKNNPLPQEWSELLPDDDVWLPYKKNIYLTFRPLPNNSEFYIRLYPIMTLFQGVMKPTVDSFVDNFRNSIKNKVKIYYNYSMFILYLSYLFFTFSYNIVERSSSSHRDHIPIFLLLLKEKYKVDISTFDSGFLKLITPRKLGCFSSKVVFTSSHFEMICTQFESYVKHPGNYISCDEKLYKWTSKTINIFYCPKKPSKKGLWYFEAVSLTESNLPYLLKTSLRLIPKKENKNSVVEMISTWIELFESLQRTTKDKPILVLDSFYSSKDSVNRLINAGIPFIIGLRKNTLNGITEGQLTIKSFQTSDSDFVPTKAYYNKNKPSILTSGTLDKNNRSKDYYTYLHGFEIKDNNQEKIFFSEIDNLYKTHFSGCDKFNLRMSYLNSHILSRRIKPNKEDSTHTAFILKTIVINSYTYFISQSKFDPKKYNIGKYYMDMSIDLFHLAHYYYKAEMDIHQECHEDYDLFTPKFR